MNPKYIFTFLAFIFIGCTKDKPQLGKAIITNQFEYENSSSYFKHDNSMKTDLLDNPVEIEKSNNSISIRNNYGDGFTGHHILINLDSNLNIKEASYEAFTDVEDGSSTYFTIEKIIVCLSKNPFLTTSITGFYTIQLKQDFNAGNTLKKQGWHDTTYYSVFQGKFKI